MPNYDKLDLIVKKTSSLELRTIKGSKVLNTTYNLKHT